MSRELSNFGSPEYPLRPSQLGHLLECNLRAALEHTDHQSSDGNSAAQTGSILHAMVAAFHRHASVEEAFRVACEEYPDGSPAEARDMYERYANDPRNATAEVTHIEFPVRLALLPHRDEVQGTPIVIEGTLDQIRRVDGVLRVFDLKTGKSEGWNQIHHHAIQLAAYTLAATQTLREPVEPGSLIIARKYLVRKYLEDPSPPGVFWSMPFDSYGAMQLLTGIAEAVYRVRRGDVHASPGTACDWCRIGGLQECLPRSESLTAGRIPLKMF